MVVVLLRSSYYYTEKYYKITKYREGSKILSIIKTIYISTTTCICIGVGM